jgi:hypothetical protein
VTFKEMVRQWLADDPPTPSPTSMTSTPTPNGNIVPPDPLVKVTELMLTMMKESQRETRELVLSILQGRPENGSTTTNPQSNGQAPESVPMVNYDDDSIPLPGGLMSVLDREQREEEEVRLLRSEQEGLARQLAEARMRLIQDPQGPDFTTS